MGIGRQMYPLLVSSLLLLAPVFADTKSYVVYLGGHSHGPDGTLTDFKIATDNHYNLLGSFLGSQEKASESLIYSYTKSINGFAANLNEEEAEEIAKRPDVLSVFPNRLRKLHTTKSWEFMGLEKDGAVGPYSIWARAKYGQDVIIANIDTGVWPESESFNDEDMQPIPPRWKGFCENVADPKHMVKCNRKLIGARHFCNGRPVDDRYDSARDFDGHGTHTLSTAGGRLVPGANIFGIANGTAKGGSPGARVAAYKVCSDLGCYDADVLAAFDAAIHDGVDVISASLGGSEYDYFSNSIAIGSFHAMQRGIPVVCSAGNDGPMTYTASNTAPWILTVAAGSDGRVFTSRVSLGNGRHAEGWSIASERLPPKKLYPMVDSVMAKVANATKEQAQYCEIGSLDPDLVKGKIVVCLRGDTGRMEKADVVSKAGGIGMIVANDANFGNELQADAYMFPAVHVNYAAATVIYSYLNSTKSPVGRIDAPQARFGLKPAPYVALFSSRGPSYLTPQILKPDILAPGVNILAAFSQGTAPTDEPWDKRRVAFNILSGTSMSCPHVSGVVGLLRSLYPHWTPAALRSAIMTTARNRDNTKQGIRDSFMGRASPLDYGAGHMRPNRAVHPGLVYDLTTVDYLNFLCSLGYNATQMGPFTSGFACPKKSIRIQDLNYPSLTWFNLTGPVAIGRTLKNVGEPGTYKALVRAPAGVAVVVEPEILDFEKVGEEKTFRVTAAPRSNGTSLSRNAFGLLTWSDGKHYVRSPLSVIQQPSEFSSFGKEVLVGV
ncbi:unnamed protein product [Spirodela intermedia]|uniref:Uncharacterized protein n=1 Tax=Spirodela intermedia TaxID=51605 RepID=A0A7I8LAX0_SPIIN|nr:unnamed protein product [Spirodela intermedia]